jgi:hypothetical protein
MYVLPTIESVVSWLLRLSFSWETPRIFEPSSNLTLRINAGTAPQAVPALHSKLAQAPVDDQTP